MDVVQVEVVDAQVCELLAGDRGDGRGRVEGIPELGDDEEVGARYEAFLDGAGEALAGFDFVAVVWGRLERELRRDGGALLGGRG